MSIRATRPWYAPAGYGHNLRSYLYVFKEQSSECSSCDYRLENINGCCRKINVSHGYDSVTYCIRDGIKGPLALSRSSYPPPYPKEYNEQEEAINN
jgi:hypothetical protein